MIKINTAKIYKFWWTLLLNWRINYARKKMKKTNSSQGKSNWVIFLIVFHLFNFELFFSRSNLIWWNASEKNFRARKWCVGIGKIKRHNSKRNVLKRSRILENCKWVGPWERIRKILWKKILRNSIRNDYFVRKNSIS